MHPTDPLVFPDMPEPMAAINAALAAQETRLLRALETTYRQIEALHALYALLPLRAPLPPMRAWAISPDFAVLLADLLMQHQPRVILELGSGVSTLVSAYCAERCGGHVFAIEHDATFAAVTRERLARHGLDAAATVYDAPLRQTTLNGETCIWYDAAVVGRALDAAGAPVEFLTVDGPPQEGVPQPQVRYPALPLLADRLAHGAHILMDDTARADEAAIAGRWAAEQPAVLLRQYDFEKGAALLRWQG